MMMRSLTTWSDELRRSTRLRLPRIREIGTNREERSTKSYESSWPCTSRMQGDLMSCPRSSVRYWLKELQRMVSKSVRSLALPTCRQKTTLGTAKSKWQLTGDSTGQTNLRSAFQCSKSVVKPTRSNVTRPSSLATSPQVEGATSTQPRI